MPAKSKPTRREQEQQRKIEELEVRLHQAEETLRESQERCRLLFDRNPDGAFTVGTEGRFVLANAACETITGYTVEELLGKTFMELCAPDQLARTVEHFQQSIGEPRYTQLEAAIIRKDGRRVDLWIAGVTVIRDGHVAGIHCTAKDVTERKRGEETLKFLVRCGAEPGEDFFQSLARYLAQSLGMDYVCIDRLAEGSLTAQTVAVFFDGKFENNVSYTLKDTPCGDVVRERVCCFPSDVRNLFPRDPILQEMRAESYAGTILWGSHGQPIGLIAVLGRKPLANPDLVTAILQLVAARAAGELERKGAEEQLRQARAGLEVRVQERTADLERAVGDLGAEVAQRRQSEEALRESELRYRSLVETLDRRIADRTEDLDRSNRDLEQFAYVASHDLQEPLRIVTGFLKLLEERYKQQLDAKAREYIDFSLDGSARMATLINDLLEYSRVTSKARQPAAVNLAEVADYAKANLRAAIEESDALITVDGLPTVLADEGQMRQLLQNLLGNALKFRAKGRRCEVHIAARPQAGEWLVQVQDNGIGIDPKQADRLFMLFQRLHSRQDYPGTGIGLAICKKIVERHGGRIWVESRLAQGATFCFTLPAGIG